MIDLRSPSIDREFLRHLHYTLCASGVEWQAAIARELRAATETTERSPTLERRAQHVLAGLLEGRARSGVHRPT